MIINFKYNFFYVLWHIIFSLVMFDLYMAWWKINHRLNHVIRLFMFTFVCFAFVITILYFFLLL